MNINQIYLEDSYHYIKNIPDHSIDCIYTDIPYLYSNSGMQRKSDTNNVVERIRKKREVIHFMSKGIDYSILDDFVRIMKKVNCFIWCSKAQILPILNFFDDYKQKKQIDLFWEILFWGKNNPQPATNSTWLPDVEYCLYFREKGVKLNDGYDIKHKYYISSVNYDDKKLYKHPSIKPLNIVKNHLLHCTQEGDVICDPFMGSGTTCVGAKELNRKYIGIEKEKKWFDIADQRLNGIDQYGQTSIFTEF